MGDFNPSLTSWTEHKMFYDIIIKLALDKNFKAVVEFN